MKEIERLWKLQLQFNGNFFNFASATSAERQQYTKEIILHVVSECDEVLREINWKMHREEAVEVVDVQAVLEEIIDLQKYVFTLAQIWGVTPQQYLTEFDRKSEVVAQRFKQEMQLRLVEDEKIAAIDIDGVLAEYPAGFVSFLEEKTGKKLSQIPIPHYDLYAVLSKEVGGYAEMKKYKHEYRATGQKRFLPVVDGAVASMKRLKKLGYTVVLLSARPVSQYPRIFADTMEWLKANDIPYDAILWDENKEEKVVKSFPKMQFMVEDHAGNANRVARMGYKVYLISKPYNVEEPLHEGVIRVDSWTGMNEYVTR